MPDPCLVMGDSPSVVCWTDGNVHLGFGYIDAYVGLFRSMSTSCELLARPCKMRARLAQATVRAVREGCGDPRFVTVFYDLGGCGLPRPDPPK